MTETEELALYKKALVDWEKPIEQCAISLTDYGFCHYFYFVHSIPFRCYGFETLKAQRKTHNDDDWHYKNEGSHRKGRQQRVTALKNAIEILENKLKQEV